MSKKQKKAQQGNWKTENKTIFWLWFAVASLGIVAGVVIVLGCLGCFGNENKPLNQYLPDSLGGFIGVLFGFVIEFTLIQHLRDAQKRQTLRGLLSVEFIGALQDMKQIKETLGFDVWETWNFNYISIAINRIDEQKAWVPSNLNVEISFSAETQKCTTITPCTVKEFCETLYKMNLPILEDVMDSAENLSLFKEETFLCDLRDINISYLRINEVYNRNRECVCNKQVTFEAEKEFLIVMHGLKVMTEKMEKLK